MAVFVSGGSHLCCKGIGHSSRMLACDTVPIAAVSRMLTCDTVPIADVSRVLTGEQWHYLLLLLLLNVPSS